MTTTPNRLTLKSYQEIALTTDQNRRAGVGGVRFPILGLFGEVGSLLAEAKKNQRDGLAYADFREAMVEEFGDALWYFSNLASRAGTTLASLDSQNAIGRLPAVKINRMSSSDVDGFEGRLIRLAGEVGTLVNAFGNEADAAHESTLVHHLPKVFSALADAAHFGGIGLLEAAEKNIKKIRDRWPEPNAEHTPLFDGGFDSDEQLPREIKMFFIEKKVGEKIYAIQKCNGIKIGDRLTDNMTEDDGYRYHDIFHLAFAAVLGWSPVIRALFKCKRKSNSVVDEVEDGARAIIIEEGVSTWAFNYAARHNFFEGRSSLDYDLLKRIRVLVKGFEVERCALWEWEKAILTGYDGFRKIRKNHGGLVHANLLRRTITVE
jgi:hypothetical protein